LNWKKCEDAGDWKTLLGILGNFVLLTSRMALIIDFRLDALLVPTLKSCVTEQQLCELIIAAK
jgi:hypothetical protein